MAASTSAGPGRIFISYRRDDSAYPAGWLYDRLCAHLGSDQVFKDVDSIDPGDDFVRVLEDAVGSCRVLLALIGDRWLDITNETGHRRLDDPNDFMRSRSRPRCAVTCGSYRSWSVEPRCPKVSTCPTACEHSAVGTPSS
jgi:hypothetical protein